MGYSDPGPRPVDLEAHRHLLQFLRGLRGLDSALGRWRPNYGGLASPDDLAAEAGVDLVEAHRLYAEGLGYFASRPPGTWGLEEASRGDVSAAIADARSRFDAPVVPIGPLTYAAAPGKPARPPEVRPAADPAAARPPPAGTRVALSPWEARRTRAGQADGQPPAPRRAGDGSAPAPPPPGRRVAVAVGAVALLVMAAIVAAVVVGARTLFASGPTASASIASPGLATLPASALPSGTPPNVLAPLQACTTIPSGKLASGLSIASSSSGIGVDPASGYTIPFVGVKLAGTVGAGTPAFSLVAAILPSGVAPPSSGPAVDRAGTFQLIAYWDGSHWHGALRSWSGTAWTLAVNSSAGVDVAASSTSISLYWQGLVPGDLYGVIVAGPGGCADQGMSSALSPQQPYDTPPPG